MGNHDNAHPSNSCAQKCAEATILELASERLGKRLTPLTWTTDGQSQIKIDGVAEDGSILAEVYARQTALKPGNERKVMTDALRLLWFRDFFSPAPRLVLCLSSRAAARSLVWDAKRCRWPSWKAELLHDLGIEVEVFDLPNGEEIERAQDDQKR